MNFRLQTRTLCGLRNLSPVMRQSLPMKFFLERRSARLRNFGMSLAIFILAASAITFAQTLPPKPPAAPSLRISVRLIQVNVIAEDSDGQPIRDLKKEDFTILEQGQLQQISLFAQQNDVPPAPTADASSTTTSSPPSELNAHGATSKFFSNHVQRSPSGANSVTVVLIDTVNTAFRDLPYVRSQVTEFLKNLRPQDQVALYLLTPSKLYTLHDFTNDSETLLRLVSGRKIDTGSAPDDSRSVEQNAGDARAKKLLDDAFAEANRFFQGGRGVIESTNLALRQIASNVANIPGRKSLVWISDGFPVTMGFGGTARNREDRPDFNLSLSITAKILGDADVAIYPVDARGLVAPTGGSNVVSTNFDAMLAIADVTGGHAFYNTNDITAAIRTAVDDSRISYLLGYYPTNDAWNGTFRGITLKVSRPGVRLRYRTGYYADAEVDAKEITSDRRIYDAVRSPLQLMNLGLEVQAEPVASADGREMKVQVRVDPTRMHFEQNGDRWTDTVDIVWVGMSSDGRVIDKNTDTVGMRPAQAGYDEIQQKGFSFTEHVHLTNQSVEMRLVVRDRGTGAIGSVNIPLNKIFMKANANPAAH
jgi:VWFA-related protein